MNNFASKILQVTNGYAERLCYYISAISHVLEKNVMTSRMLPWKSDEKIK